MSQPPRRQHDSRGRWYAPLGLLCVLVACAPEGCPGGNDAGSAQCRLDRDCAINQLCKDGTCEDKHVCGSDSACPAEQRCDVLSGACVFRNGFGTDCGPQNGGVACPVGKFCSLGRCRDTATATQCSRRFNCPVGQVCDRHAFFCIEENPCTLATPGDGGTGRYPELACDPGDRCVQSIGLCVSDAPPDCTPGATPSGCAIDEICNPAGRCVQCVTDTDCGAGLRCNSRAGLCESSNTCRSDAECNAPLVCDRTTAVCAVPLPPCTSDFQCQLGQFCDRVAGTCQYKEGKCQDDRFEPNDSAPNARPVDLSAGETTLAELVLCANNPDVYKVPLVAGDELTVVIAGARAQARAEMWVLTPDGLHTLRFVEAPPRGNGTLTLLAQQAGNYLVRVESIAGQSPYSLTFRRTTGQVCAADSLEGTNGNNTPFRASTAHAGLTSLSLCPGDEDWLIVHGTGGVAGVRAGQAISVAMTGPVGADFDLVLTDVLGATVLASSSGPTADEFLRYRAASDMDVLIGVTPYGPSSGPYTLNIAIQPVLACVPDHFEAYTRTADGTVVDAGPPSDAGATDAAVAEDGGTLLVGNNARSTAIPVGLDGLVDDLTVCRNEEDWFEIQVLAHQRALVEASWPFGEAGVHLEVFDDTGAFLRRVHGTTLSALSVNGNDAGRVYLRVTSPAAESPYHLDIRVESRAICPPDHSEPNNTPALASPPALATDGLYAICGSDHDHFRIEAGAGRRVRASIDFSTVDGDLDLALLLPDGVSVLALSDGVSDHESLDVVLPANPVDGGLGAYFLDVFAARSDSRAPYRIHTEVSAP